MEPRTDSVVSDTKKMEITQFYPTELRYIKALFAQRQYRQCIGVCRESLDTLVRQSCQHPAFEASASFYLALAHDELARLMHEHSQLKLPTYNQAEIYYQETIRALPTLQVCRESLMLAQTEGNFREADGVPASAPSDNSLDSLPSYSIPSSPPVFPSHLTEGNLASRSPQQIRRDTTISDLSDFSSHDSFDEIMTPNRMLKRDVSRMSLLDQPLKRDYSSMSLLAPHPQLQKSTSQGLLRPIRRGSPPKAYHLPSKLSYVGKTPSKSRIPHLPALQISDSPTRKPRSRLDPMMLEPERLSPNVSPLESVSIGSDASTVSPILIEMPARNGVPEPKLEPTAGELDLSHVNEHLEAMHAQIKTHLCLLRRARLATTIAQAERASHVAEPVSRRMDSITSRGGKQDDGMNRRMPTSKSFWSFTPVDVKAAELQKRVEMGRARGWNKERFRPQKYMDLAEKALAEL